MPRVTAHVHPATYFIRYLTLVLDDVTRESVSKELAAVGLAGASQDQVSAAAHEMSQGVPADFRPWTNTHLPSVRWLREKKVYSLVHRDDAVQAVQEIILDPQKREAVERMLLGRISHAEIAYRMKGLGHQVDELSVADYRHYFWNTEIMGFADWAEYFSDDRKGRTRHLEDDYISALVAGRKLSLYRSGVKQELDRKEVMDELYQELFFTFQEVKTQPLTAKKVEMLATLSRSISRLDERKDASDSALADVLKKFERFTLVSDDTKLTALTDLAPLGSVSDTQHRKLSIAKEAQKS